MSARASVLVLPGQKRGSRALADAAKEILYELYLEFEFANPGPFKVLRFDRYCYEMDMFVATFMRPTKGGEEFDNRRRTT